MGERSEQKNKNIGLKGEKGEDSSTFGIHQLLILLIVFS